MSRDLIRKAKNTCNMLCTCIAPAMRWFPSDTIAILIFTELPGSVGDEYNFCISSSTSDDEGDDTVHES